MAATIASQSPVTPTRVLLSFYGGLPGKRHTFLPFLNSKTRVFKQFQLFQRLSPRQRYNASCALRRDRDEKRECVMHSGRVMGTEEEEDEGRHSLFSFPSFPFVTVPHKNTPVHSSRMYYFCPLSPFSGLFPLKPTSCAGSTVVRATKKRLLTRGSRVRCRCITFSPSASPLCTKGLEYTFAVTNDRGGGTVSWPLVV